MNDSDRKRFAQTITALTITFGLELNDARLLGYWMGLKDLTIDQVENAIGKAIQTSTRMPVPAELRSYAMGGTANERAMSAWNDVQKAANVSYMQDLDFEDCIINAVIRNLGGRWNFFERLTSGAESEKWLRIEFVKAYEVYASAIPSDEALKPLIGMATHGEVCGRRHVPRIAMVTADTTRAKIAPKRTCQAIEHRSRDIPKVEFRNA
jgi:hypothetical protein